MEVDGIGAGVEAETGDEILGAPPGVAEEIQGETVEAEAGQLRLCVFLKLKQGCTIFGITPPAF